MLSNLGAQDLIKNTINGKNPKSANTPNINSRLANELAKRNKNNIKTIDLFSFCSDKTAPEITNKITDAIELNYIGNTLKSSFKELKDDDIIKISIPVSTKKHFDLLLYPTEIVNNSFTLMSGNGTLLSGEGSLSQTKSFRGIVEGYPQSIASATYYDGKWDILVADDDGNYNIGRLYQSSNTYILYNDRNQTFRRPFQCGSDQLPSTGKELQSLDVAADVKVLKSTPQCLSLYIECDYDMYIRHGSSVSAVENYLINLVTAVNTTYANLFIDVRVQTIVVWTTPDPYINLMTTSSVLTAFGDRLRDNFNGELAHWLSTRNLGGGVAWVDQLCSSYSPQQSSGPYAVSAELNTSFAPFPTYSWDVLVFSHEMGHNLGSPHTHSCTWPGGAIDNCAPPEGNCAPGPRPFSGSIMSYCHQSGNPGISLNNFGNFPGNLIRQKVNGASCQPSCNCSKFVHLAKALIAGPQNAREFLKNQGNSNNIFTSATLNAPIVELFGQFTVAQNATLEINNVGCNN